MILVSTFLHSTATHQQRFRGLLTISLFFLSDIVAADLAVGKSSLKSIVTPILVTKETTLVLSILLYTVTKFVGVGKQMILQISQQEPLSRQSFSATDSHI